MLTSPTPFRAWLEDVSRLERLLAACRVPIAELSPARDTVARAKSDLERLVALGETQRAVGPAPEVAPHP